MYQAQNTEMKRKATKMKMSVTELYLIFQEYERIYREKEKTNKFWRERNTREKRIPKGFQILNTVKAGGRIFFFVKSYWGADFFFEKNQGDGGFFTKKI